MPDQNKPDIPGSISLSTLWAIAAPIAGFLFMWCANYLSARLKKIDDQETLRVRIDYLEKQIESLRREIEHLRP
jgi:hypothetical protein